MSGRGGLGAGDRVAAWLAPALAFVVLVGSLGVTTELAFDEELSWQQVVVWVAVVYAVAGLAAGLGKRRLQIVPNAVYGAISGALAASAIIMLFLALDVGDASRVVPVTSAYPALTLGLAALILSERVTWRRAGGTLLVIGGVILILSE